MVFCLLTVFVGQYVLHYQTTKVPSPQYYEITKNMQVSGNGKVECFMVVSWSDRDRLERERDYGLIW